MGLQQHHVFSTDVFSYTAAGQPWIYPVLSGLIFYLLFLAGGYALLSWFGAVAVAGTVALLLKKEQSGSIGVGAHRGSPDRQSNPAAGGDVHRNSVCGVPGIALEAPSTARSLACGCSRS